MLSEKLLNAMNEQVGHELSASLQYVSIAAWFDGQDLPELAGFFYRQADEERDHAMKFVHFVVDAGGALEVPAIPAPVAAFGSAAEGVRQALEGERKVTDQIYRLVEIAQGDSNYIAVRFLDWFVNEQFEEVGTMQSLLSVVERAGEDNLLLVEQYVVREGDPHPGQ